mgnify:CR=1 FL=1
MFPAPNVSKIFLALVETLVAHVAVYIGTVLPYLELKIKKNIFVKITERRKKTFEKTFILIHTDTAFICF